MMSELRGMTVPVLALLLGGCNLIIGLQPATLDGPDAGTGGATATATATATSSTGGPSCSDGMKNGTETDKDCGGDSCGACLEGEDCTKNADCQSDVCSMQECAPPACTSAPCSGDTLFAKRAGDVGDEISRALATDGADVYVTGTFSGAMNFGGGSVTAMEANDIYFARLDAAGHQVYADRFGGAGVHYGAGLAVDANQAVVITGSFNNAVEFGIGPLMSVGGQDGFLAKFSPSELPLWSKQFGDKYNQYSASAAFDTKGNILICGANEGTIDFGAGPITSPGAGFPGGSSAFVAKFDSSGNHLWSKGFGDGSDQSGVLVVPDTAGNVLFLAQGGGTFDFGGGVLTSNEGDFFVAKFDASGKHMWSHGFGGADIQYGDRIAVDAMGDVFILAHGPGSVDFGGGTLSAAGDSDIFVAKLDPAGKHVWSRRFGYPGGAAAGVGLDVDADNHVFVTGRFEGKIDFGGGLLTSAGKKDIFVAKLSAKGGHLWSRRFGDAEDQYPTGTVFASGLFITGYFAGSVDFGSGPLMSAGGTDVFVAKLYP